MFQVASVHKGYTVDGVLIAHCDEYVPYVDKGVQTEPSSPPNADGKEQTTMAVLNYSTIQSVKSAQALFLPYPRTGPAPVLQLPLRTSDEPTFIRTVQESTPPWAHMNVPGRQIAKDTTTSSSAVVPPPAADQGIPEERPLTIQDKIERQGTPRNLTEAELIGSALAKGLSIPLFPGFFDALTGPPGPFNLHEQLNVYGYTPRQTNPTPIDYGVALVSRLNIAPPTGTNEEDDQLQTGGEVEKSKSVDVSIAQAVNDKQEANNHAKSSERRKGDHEPSNRLCGETGSDL
jgi:hypothetical protein